MYKQLFRKAWTFLGKDKILITLLLTSAVYFVVYYVTDPVRPGGLITHFYGSSGPIQNFTGWFGYYDQGQYLQLANTLAHFRIHELASTYTYGIGYPLVAVPAIWLGFGKDPFVFFNFLTFCFSVCTTYYVAKKLISPFAGFIAGFGLLFATPLIHYTDQPWNSTVCLFVMPVILIMLTFKKITHKHLLFLGFLLAWAFSARYIDVLFLGTLSLAVIYRGSVKDLIKNSAYMFLGSLVLLVPVLYSHYHYFGSPLHTPYVNHLGIGGVDGSDQGLKAYSLRRVPRAGLALFLSPRLAGSTDGDRGLLIDFFWALAAIPGIALLIKKKNHEVFFRTLLAVGLLACTFYLSFRASTPGSLKYGELHYFKMYWPCLAILASAYIDKVYTQANSLVKKRKA